MRILKKLRISKGGSSEPNEPHLATGLYYVSSNTSNLYIPSAVLCQSNSVVATPPCAVTNDTMGTGLSNRYQE